MEEKKKKLIIPVAWAWLVLVLIGIVYILIWITNALTQIFGYNNIFDKFPRAFRFVPMSVTLILLFVIFIGSLVSLLGLIIKKVSVKKPYVYAIISMAGSIFIIGSLFIQSSSRTTPRKYLCDRKLVYLSERILDISKANHNKYKKKNWCDSIKDVFGSEHMFKCPVDKTGPCSYAMNENIPADANELPGDLVLLFESTPGWNQTGGTDDVVTDRHGEKNPGANIAFADGHVEFVKPEAIPTLRWRLETQKRGAATTR